MANNGDAQRLEALAVALRDPPMDVAPASAEATDSVVMRVDAAAQLCREVGRYAREHGEFLHKISTAYAAKLEEMTEEYAQHLLEAEGRKMAELKRIMGKLGK
jgi:hypothetical protein